ncbi:cytochrome b5 domain-containing protein [Candidatus Saccharibacteria bacterium]|nr:cytochrome b5 domain-containing protein [Candidatus Saccharibacteria bacterium]
MKKLLLISLILFSVFMSYVFIGGAIQKQQKENDAESGVKTSAPTIDKSVPQKAFTINEVSTHSRSSDCWLIINNKVYNVAKFLGEHPGGASTIIPYCGKEATKAFDTQDRGPGHEHSSEASQMLGDYLIGTIKTN